MAFMKSFPEPASNNGGQMFGVNFTSAEHNETEAPIPFAIML